MSNFYRAVKALEEADEFHGAMVDNEAYVRALQAAGLLAPDLPEPDAVKLNGDIKYFAARGIQVRHNVDSHHVQMYSRTLLTPAEARSLALALLAAADSAENEQHNEHH